MTIVLFRSDDQLTIRDPSSAVQTAPVFFEAESAQGVTLDLSLSWSGFYVGPELDIELSDRSSVNLGGEVGEYFEVPQRGARQSSILMHRHFSHYQCKYSTVQPGTDSNYGEALGNRIAGRLPSIPDDKGFKSRDTSIPSNPSCITATKKDQSQVVVIDPLSSVVTMLDHRGVKLDKYSMPKGEFADVIAMDGDNDYYWVMRWESADFHGGNKFNFNAYRWEDSSLVEWEWESSVSTDIDIGEDRILLTEQGNLYENHFIESEVLLDGDFFIDSYVSFLQDRDLRTDVELEELVAYALTDIELELFDHIVSTDVTTTTVYALDTEVEVDDYHAEEGISSDIMLDGDTAIVDATQEVWSWVWNGVNIEPDIRERNAVSLDVPEEFLVGNAIDISITDEYFVESFPHVFTEVDLSEIRVEMRFSNVRHAYYTDWQPEQNYLRQMFNMEFDVWPLDYSFNPVRTNEMRHEYPFMEEKRHYYGHWSDYEFAKEQDLEMVDGWFVPEIWNTLPSISYNAYGSKYNNTGPLHTRGITAPNFAVTETKMIFGVTRHRGMWPYRDERHAITEKKYRSSQTLLMQLDKGTKWPSTRPVNVNMSGTAAFQANDNLGLVMVDSFWEMGNDDWLKGFGKTAVQDGGAYYTKLNDIVRYNFDFVQVAAKVKMHESWLSEYTTSTLATYTLGENKVNERNADQLSVYQEPVLSTSTYGTDLHRRVTYEPMYNGCMRLNDTSIIFRDLFQGFLYAADNDLTNYYTKAYDDYYDLGNGWKSSNFYGYDTFSSATATIAFLQEFNDDLETENIFFTNDPLVNILSYYKEDVVWALSSFVDLMPQTSYHYIAAGADELHKWFLDRNQCVSIEGTLSRFTSPELQYLNANSIKVDAALDSSTAISLDVLLSDLGYRDITVIISNSSPNEEFYEEGYAIGRAYGAPGYCGYTIPSGIHGTYPHGARFWSPGGQGYDYYEHTTVPTWKITNLRPRHNRSTSWQSGGINWTAPYWTALYSSYPYPVQYVVDNVNNELFGLHRLMEGHDFTDFTDLPYASLPPSATEDYDSLQEYLDDGNTYAYNIRIGPGYSGDTQNTGAGAWLHKYDAANQEAVATVYIPGYFHKDTQADYDPFVQIRYFGNSPTNKRLYVIRAYGRRDYYHNMPYKYYGQYQSYVTDISAEIPVYWDSPEYYTPYVTQQSYNDYFYNNDRRTLFIEGQTLVPNNVFNSGGVRKELNYATFNGAAGTVNESTKYISITYDYAYNDPGRIGLRGFGPPSEDNVANLTPIRNDGASNYFPEGGRTQYVFTSDHLTNTVNYPFHYSTIDPGKVPLYEQKPNVYDNRDILVYDYDLNLVTTISSVLGLSDEDVILHVIERNNVFYILTHVKAEEQFSWGQQAATHSYAPQPAPMAYQDDKYGYCYDRTRLYKIPQRIQGTAELIYEFDWAGHSVGDTLIQEVTDHHVWLNWSGVHKERSGAFMGVGVRLDGTGYDEVPGLIAIIYDYYEPEKWHLMCYTNISQTNYQSGYPTAEKFVRWGDGERTKLSIYRESDISLLKHDKVYHPINEWLENMPGWYYQYDVYGDHIYHASSILGRKRGGPQPGYSQVIRRRYYDWVYSDVSLRAISSSLKPQTWISTTTGGPNTVSL